jgi:hypothetical protein
MGKSQSQSHARAKERPNVQRVFAVELHIVSHKAVGIAGVNLLQGDVLELGGIQKWRESDWVIGRYDDSDYGEHGLALRLNGGSPRGTLCRRTSKESPGICVTSPGMIFLAESDVNPQQKRRVGAVSSIDRKQVIAKLQGQRLA